MHALWGEILAEALDQRSPLLLVAAFVVVPLMRYAAPEERSRRSGIFLLVAAHLVLVPLAGPLRAGPHPGYAQVHAVTLALGACLAVFLGGALLFMVALPRLRLDPPRILQDVMISVAALVGLLWVASSQGLDVSGVVAIARSAAASISATVENFRRGAPLVAAATSEAYFDFVNGVYGSWFGRLVLFGYTWALVHHLLGGIRHFIWDTGHALEKHTATKMAWATLATTPATKYRNRKRPLPSLSSRAGPKIQRVQRLVAM